MILDISDAVRSADSTLRPTGIATLAAAPHAQVDPRDKPHGARQGEQCALRLPHVGPEPAVREHTRIGVAASLEYACKTCSRSPHVSGMSYYILEL